MYVETIGKVIAKLRKNLNVTQEALAKAVGVSAQAVSKWENGGVPDTELLPRIAAFFHVSIDALFEREIDDFDSIRKALIHVIANTEPALRFDRVFAFCWDMERAMFGEGDIDGGIEACEAVLGEDDQRYSCILTDEGFTRMGVANRLQYYLIVPEAKDKDKAFFGGIDYLGLFRDLSDKSFFDTMIFFHKRQDNKPFTPNLLIQNLHVDFDKANALIKMLDKYKMILTEQIEIDGTKQEVYRFLPTPSFAAMLIFARELLDRPDNFRYYFSDRKRPYLG